MLEENKLVFEPAEVRELWNQLDASIPAEKERARKEKLQIAQDLKAEGGHKFEGGGQKMASIDARTYMRWHQQFPGCWADQGFVDEFLWHNPEYCAPGYRPRQPRDFKFIK